MTIHQGVILVATCLWIAGAWFAPNKLAVVVITAWFGTLGLVLGTVLVHLHPVIRFEKVNALVVPAPSINLAPADIQRERIAPRLTGVGEPVTPGATLRVQAGRPTPNLT